jgi:inner membrane protein
MSMLTDFVANLGPWNWMFLAIVLIGLETIVPGVHFAWFAAAALIVGIAAVLTGISLPWQIVAFAGLAVASAFLARRYARPQMQASDEPYLNERAAQYVGRVVMVEEPISGGRGKVRVGDTLWQAEGADIAAGARVRITAARGSIFVVEPAAG